MIHSITVLSLVASVAFAQQTLIPSGISSGCADLLTTINGDSSLSSCLSTINSATSAFAPGSNNQKSASSSGITSALGTLCSGDSVCSASNIRTNLAQFSSKCSSELSSSNADVTALYEALYLLYPLRTAVCAKGDDGSYCLPSIAKNIGDDSKTLVDNYLVVQNRAVANSTTYCSSNLAFGFIDPSLPSDKLCTTCTKQVVSAYIDFESNTPYALGLSNSKYLCGQNKLYDAVNSQCPNLLGGAVQAAGGLSAGFGSDNSNAAPSSFGLSMRGIVGAFLGVASLSLF